MLKAQRPDGTIVREGEFVKDFRGDGWTFVGATRASEPGRSGKVVVSRGTARREFYATVFSLSVIDS